MATTMVDGKGVFGNGFYDEHLKNYVVVVDGGDDNGGLDQRVDVEDSYEPYTEPDVDSNIQVDIDTCDAFVDDLRARGTDVRVVVETAAKEEVESSARGTTEVEVDSRVGPVIDDDVRESVREDVPDHVIVDGAVEVTYETLRDQGHRIVATSQQSATMSERIGMLEQDNVRLIGMLDVERQIVDRLQRSMSRVQRDLRQIRCFRFYGRMRLGRLEACARKHLGYFFFLDDELAMDELIGLY
ncbi:hypothetical protein Tco_1054292 [Tanacetum coccineum]|uniref:Uncharacterized protein n=1 Tax=Tanacetum coccineum TaxID=301880 RepID=A0ABQ5GXW2_9ASTR